MKEIQKALIRLFESISKLQKYAFKRESMITSCFLSTSVHLLFKDYTTKRYLMRRKGI